MGIRKLNTLRGLAALIVMIAHFSNGTNWLNGFLGHGAGQIGVMFFFMLSGFLLSYLYMKKKANKINIKSYAVKRGARVIPLFFAIVISSYVLQKNGITEILYRIPSAEIVLSHLVFFKGVSVLWTIPAIIQFYTIFILIWWLSSRKEGYVYILMAAVLIFLFFINFTRPKGHIGSLPYDLALLPSLPYFFVGLSFGELYKNWKAPEYLSSGWYVLVLLLIPLIYPKVFILLTGRNHLMWSDIGVLSVVSIIFFSVLFLVPDKNIFLANSVGDFLGKISYSLYLLHIPVFLQCEKIFTGTPEILLLLFIFCSFAVSYASYRLVELPFSRFIHKLASNELG